jgi:hypothetical protein
MKTITTKEAWVIARKKKSERTLLEHSRLTGWINKWICPPIRVIIFPIMLFIRLYDWIYWED